MTVRFCPHKRNNIEEIYSNGESAQYSIRNRTCTSLRWTNVPRGASETWLSRVIEFFHVYRVHHIEHQRTHGHTYTHPHTHLPTQIYIHTYPYRYIQTPTHIHLYTHTHLYTRTWSHLYPRRHIHFNIHQIQTAYTDTDISVHPTRTHTHAHAYATMYPHTPNISNDSIRKLLIYYLHNNHNNWLILQLWRARNSSTINNLYAS